ncbi:MAG: AAA family ATPase [Gammaproteobacteria bacterium]|jgi:type II secretory pathway predicted ATPase ExeA
MYDSFYHFQKSPFRLTPDPQFFFPSAAHSRGLAYLQYALYQGEGFVVISGSPGTGKTELMLNFMDRLPQGKVTAAKIVSSRLNDSDLLQLVASSFLPSIENVSKGTILKHLEKFFYAQAKSGRSLLLLIDEAHNLPVSSLTELGMLCNFQVDEKPVIQCFLMGHYALDQKLNHPQLAHLKQRVIISMHLESFSRQETQQYIEHRIRIASNGDLDNKPRFTDRALSAIHHYSEGLPRRINAVCHRVLLEGYLEEKTEIDFKLVSKVIREMQEEAVVNTNAMDLDFAQLKTAAVHQVTSKAPTQSTNTAKSEHGSGMEQPLDNIVHFSPSTSSTLQQTSEPASFNSATQRNNHHPATVNVPDTAKRQVPESATTADTQDNTDDFTIKPTTEHHWAAIPLSDDSPGAGTTTLVRKGVSTTPTHKPRKPAQRPDKTANNRGGAAKTRPDTRKRSVYQLATDHRESGMLDKELLSLASWYQPDNATTSPNEPGATQLHTAAGPSLDDPLTTESDSQANTVSSAGVTSAIAIDHEKQPHNTPAFDSRSAAARWMDRIANRLPLSPLGIGLSGLALAILWWFVYGPGSSETLRWLNAVATIVAA